MDWENALRDTNSLVDILPHIVPTRKQSADVVLLFEMARFYHTPTDEKPLIMILSRDDLLVAAAELLSAKGHSVLIALGATIPPPVATIPVVILPVDAPEKIGDSAIIKTTSNDPECLDSAVLQNATRAIRHHLGAHEKGTGYPASAVGQVLSKLGHDKAMRMRILATISEVKTDESGIRKVWLKKPYSDNR
ncbi:hypothetical protein SAMN05421693_11275 [Ectothiorhodospira magna]|uniref:Uncharacterized protein n=2 Tax=Ectothiorhodospira magna TaxID=867345 RepID=A0A1H9C7C3_9GAMM|nr:hypothetical protein SAMN05421693_11275 [Ectothiorhodospira magna]